MIQNLSCAVFGECSVIITADVDPIAGETLAQVTSVGMSADGRSSSCNLQSPICLRDHPGQEHFAKWPQMEYFFC
jgi:hypothetical protein